MIVKWYCALGALLLGLQTVNCQTTSTPTPSPTPAPYTCYNGGFPLSETQCNCPSYWIGERCENIMCVNGGARDEAINRCRCPAGYFGLHCEGTQTIKPPKNTFAVGNKFNLIDLNLYTDYWGLASYKKFQTALVNHLADLISRDISYTEYNYWYNDYVPFLSIVRSEATISNDPDSYFKKETRVYTTSASDFLDQINGTNVLKNRPRLSRLYMCHHSAIYHALRDMIIERSLQQSVVTIVTSQPPFAEDKLFTDEILGMAVTFGITVNVIWLEDDVYIRCTDNTMLRNIAQSTGGTFFSVRYGPGSENETTDGITAVLESMYQPQLLANDANTDCSGGFTFTIMPEQSRMAYYVFAKGTNVTTDTSSCFILNEVAKSYPKDMAILKTSLPSPFRCDLRITSNGSCSALAVGIDLENVGVQFYKSFVEDQTLDVSKNQPVEDNPLYIAIHMEAHSNNSMMKNIAYLTAMDSNHIAQNLTVSKRDATFEIISNNNYNCSYMQGGSWWFKVALTDDNNNTVASRIIPFLCQPKSIPPPIGTSTVKISTVRTSTVATSSSIVGSTAVAPAETTTKTEAADTPTGEVQTTEAAITTIAATTTEKLPDCQIFPEGNSQSRSYIVAYPNKITKTTYYAFQDGAINNLKAILDNRFKVYGEINYDVFPDYSALDAKANCTYDHYHSQNSYDDFRNVAIYDTYKPDFQTTLLGIGTSNILQALQAIIDPAKYACTNETNDNSTISPGQNSLLIVLANRLPPALTPDNYTNLKAYTNKNIQINFIIDQQDLKNQLALPDGRSVDTLHGLAAMTNGHVIVGRIQDDYENFANNVLSPFISNGPVGTLIFSRNVISRPFVNIGVADLRGAGTIPVFASATTHLSMDYITQSAFLLALDFNPLPGTDCNVAKQTIDLTDGYFNNTNFYSNSTTLAGGCQFNVVMRLNWVNSLNPPNVYVRIWTNKTDLPNLQLKYVRLNDSSIELPDGPDDMNGAIIRATIRNERPDQTIDTITITDCTGQVSKLLENSQKSMVNPGNNCFDLYFVPFFCLQNTSGCVAGTQGKYDIQFNSPAESVSETGISMQFSFWCDANKDDPPMKPDPSCEQDSIGNYQCLGENAPYYRGPTKQLLDCSNHGQLKYNISDNFYFCDCNPIEYYSGDSCQLATCPKKNTAPFTVDMYYRTYTVVIFIDRFSSVPDMYGDAKSVLGLPTNPTISNIWLYQLIVLCRDGTAVPLYIGPDAYLFQQSFDPKINFPDCPNTNEIGWDITAAYKASIRAVGRQQRGIIGMFYEDIDGLLDFNLESFMEISQQYRQEVYLIYVGDTENEWYITDPSKIPDKVFQGLLSTGGIVIPTNFNNQYQIQLPDKFFYNLLTSIVSINDIQINKTGIYQFYVENNGYIIMPGLDPSYVTYDNQLPENLIDDKSAFIYFAEGGKSHSVYSRNGNAKYYAFVLVLNGVAPPYAIISDDLQDSTTAVASTQTYSGTILGLNLPDWGDPPKPWYLIGNADKHSRISNRINCTFGFTTYMTLGPPQNPGPQFIYLTISDSPEPGGETKITKVFPSAVTRTFVCQNGGVPNNALGKCDCQPDFYGPDCGLLMCENGGVVSGWGDACDCGNTGVGRTCRNRGNETDFWWWNSNDY